MKAPTLPTLLEAYPGLKGMLPWIPLATLPTPLTREADFARRHGMAGFLVKHDECTGSVYGGNKVRKLEFLLGHARRLGARSVITFGAAGSNHALATAVYATALGLRAALILGPQHNSRNLQANLLRLAQINAELRAADWREIPHTAATAFYDLWRRDRVPPYVIPAGGSSPLGLMGYVNAGFELKHQIIENDLPEPSIIYVASGTMGTCAGLLLGLRLAGLSAAVHAVRVAKPPYTCMERARRLYTTANRMLHQCDSDVPIVPFPEEALILRESFLGLDYALFTPEGIQAVRIAREELGARLEGVYTGKTFAALLSDSANGNLSSCTSLFWNTYGGPLDFPSSAPVLLEKLPVSLRQYFFREFQPLEMEKRIGE